MVRSQVLTQINAIIDDKCVGCITKKNLYQAVGKSKKGESHAYRYCLNECKFGIKLQQLGKELERSKHGKS